MNTDGFLLTWFLELPWTIIGDVCLYLAPETVSETLIKVPKLRNIIIDQYYSQELHLILSPTKRPHFCSLDPQRKLLIDIVTYGEIEDFLVENPDICPRLYKVMTSGDFRSMEILLRAFHGQLSQTPELEIHVENYELLPEDVQLIFSFPNLTKFQTARIKLRRCLPVLSDLLLQLQNLRQLVFLGHEIRKWSRVRLPPNLSHLDMSWYPETDVTSVALPDSLVNLYWNQAGIDNAVFAKLTYPPLIKTLMLTYCSLASVNVSQLPPTLETIDLSYNNIRSFQFEPLTPRWPASLKSILLNANLIDDASLKQLSLIEWPEFLENLRLDENKLTSLEHLSTLPQALKYLDLSDTKLKSFRVHHNEDDYPFFRFPESLDTLNFQGCQTLTYGEASAYGAVPLEHRIKFPENLESLNLTECNVGRLAYFLFPRSLQTLSLTGNRLQNLTTYNLTRGSTEVVSWKHLNNLRELELYYNNIEGLQDWCPPKSLRRVDLRRNKITVLTGVRTPLFSKEFDFVTNNIQTLNFEENEIRTIDPALYLPRNLISLNLSKNKLTQFVFSKSFANHKSLVRLDLASNAIEKVSVDLPEKSYASHLKQFNLSRNACTNFQMSTEDFYDVFQQIGLVVTKKKHNMKSEHTFR
ncbi:L domain-like protein [Metschnikowia bicuspidata var. bicuspidata NRRL YB-4993]|uniref:L domain-like protein n=1 Tax=Metschnikowia bicuspidata var. bicuspidata NRRL YB-4993 TaxID=869754 RepID=A0A1A0HAM7_9ASCO|nr:L domain-like protein [Metschnikowia bicuspidata var. bicuspidata NRRL YB-4993]OBA20933.1 L domain-like protein [Metschnikowia bicuspidata var. bicuspidata NRRL YB-4993]